MEKEQIKFLEDILNKAKKWTSSEKKTLKKFIENSDINVIEAAKKVQNVKDWNSIFTELRDEANI